MKLNKRWIIIYVTAALLAFAQINFAKTGLTMGQDAIASDGIGEGSPS